MSYLSKFDVQGMIDHSTVDNPRIHESGFTCSMILIDGTIRTAQFHTFRALRMHRSVANTSSVHLSNIVLSNMCIFCNSILSLVLSAQHHACRTYEAGRCVVSYSCVLIPLLPPPSRVYLPSML